ncbi:hypothetical protein ASC66_06935 [Leifsonia sp. Root4]|uniref:DUF2510 domain-containing protein n=1 Tax=Leifsonia sp. Root4 TaxID=1736525 RepID=UPI000715EAA5|nr:DUF2510 domain-containing protein [Leifsonia sp. Root4]KQW06255.1 hypothetical protein ASC66_06935 [Leifsonia sp. Root4]
MSSPAVPTVLPSGSRAIAAPPAGWYPDPRGSDQLRWWDGTTWTVQLAPRPPAPPARPSAAASEGLADSPGYDWQRETERHAPMPSATPRVEQWQVRDVPGRSGTAAVWLLAFTPYLSLPLLAAADALTRGTSLDGGNSAVLFAGLALYALVFALATRDNTVLARRGHGRRAQPSWALLGALPYLIVRSVNVRRETGVGTVPLWIWVVNLLCAAALISTAATVTGPIRDLDLLGGML